MKIHLAHEQQAFPSGLIIGCIIIGFLLHTTTSAAQDNSPDPRLSIEKSNVPLKRILDEIEQQTGLVFFYNNQQIDVEKNTSIHVKDKKLSAVLNQLFDKDNIRYKLIGKQITLFPANTPPVAGNKDTTAGQPQGHSETPPAEAASSTTPTHRLNGRVIDNDTGEPLSFVLVFIQNNQKLSAVTDSEGKYSMEIPHPATDTLVFNFMGYKTQKIAVNNRHTVNSILSIENQLLDEVVVTGYQRIRKEQMTGAVATVGSEALQQRIVTDGNIATSMEGKMAGLYVDPLNPNEVQIRGVSTFNAVNNPLIVIDGFPSELQLNDINPNDVTSISLLKDAAAAAIYGVRASNGVIVITTQKGEYSGKTMFSLQANVGIRFKPDPGDLDYVRGHDYVNAIRKVISASRDQRANYTLTNKYYSLIHATQFDLNEGLIGNDKADAIFQQIGTLDNRQEYQELFYQNRINRQVDFNMNGGSERATYFLGLSYLNNDLLTKGADEQKVTVNMKGDYKINKIFNANAAIFYGYQQNRSRSTPSLSLLLPYEQLRDSEDKALPTVHAPFMFRTPSIDPDANQALIDAGFYDFNYYPYDEFRLNHNSGSSDNIRMQATLQAKIIDGIYLEAGGVYEKTLSRTNSFYDKNSFYIRGLANSHLDVSKTGAITFGIPYGAILTESNGRSENYTIRLQANIDKTIGKHNISAIAGAERRQIVSNNLLNTLFGYDDQSLISLPVNIERLTTTEWINHLSPLYNGLVATDPFNYNSLYGKFYTDNRFVSFYANAAYTFDRRYVLTGSFRIDQSNLFGTDPQYRYKPLWSVGASWNAKNESFLRNIQWIDLLKARISIGFNGNIAKDNGPFILTQTLADPRIPDYPMYNTIISPKNESLRWEETMNYNAGLDLSLFDARLALTAEYYYKYSKDVLGNTGVDPTSGFSELLQNYAEISNQGLDLSFASTNIRTEHFQWRSNLTVSFNHNRVEKVKEKEFAYSYYKAQGRVVTAGYPIDALFSYDYRGLNEKGQPLVNDGSGNIIAYTYPARLDVPIDALIYSGTVIPKYTLGFSNTISYANFDLYFMFLFNGGHVMRTPAPLPSDINLIEGGQNFWMKPGDEAHTQVPGYNHRTLFFGDDGWFAEEAVSAYRYAQSAIRKADYVKLKEIVLTYSFPKKWLQTLHIEALRIRVQVSNLWYYTFSGNDINPEAINPLSGAKNFPITPTYTLGLNLNF